MERNHDIGTRDRRHIHPPSNLSPTHSPRFGRKYQPCYTWRPIRNADTSVLPSTRSKHAMCLHQGCIYLYGGKNRNIPLKDLWKYDIVNDKWEMLRCTGEKPPFLQEHTMMAHKSKLYVFGGEFCMTQDTPLWLLDINTLVWRKHVIKSEVTTPISRRGHTVVLAQNAMHIYGGYVDLKGSTTELWSFDFELEIWNLSSNNQLHEEGPCGRHLHSAVVSDCNMWVYGGMNDLTPKADTWKWSFAIHDWIKVKCKQGPPPLSGHSACTVNDGMLIFGGRSSGQLQDELWKLHFSTCVWQKIHYTNIVKPAPKTQHCALLLPHTFAPTTIQEQKGSNRTLSLPHLKEKTLKVDVLSHRPSSSPVYLDSSKQKTFHNKIQPSLLDSSKASIDNQKNLKKTSDSDSLRPANIQVSKKRVMFIDSQGYYREVEVGQDPISTDANENYKEMVGSVPQINRGFSSGEGKSFGANDNFKSFGRQFSKSVESVLSGSSNETKFQRQFSDDFVPYKLKSSSLKHLDAQKYDNVVIDHRVVDHNERSLPCNGNVSGSGASKFWSSDDSVTNSNHKAMKVSSEVLTERKFAKNQSTEKEKTFSSRVYQKSYNLRHGCKKSNYYSKKSVSMGDLCDIEEDPESCRSNIPGSVDSLASRVMSPPLTHSCIDMRASPRKERRYFTKFGDLVLEDLEYVDVDSVSQYDRQSSTASHSSQRLLQCQSSEEEQSDIFSQSFDSETLLLSAHTKQPTLAYINRYNFQPDSAVLCKNQYQRVSHGGQNALKHYYDTTVVDQNQSEKALHNFNPCVDMQSHLEHGDSERKNKSSYTGKNQENGYKISAPNGNSNPSKGRVLDQMKNGRDYELRNNQHFEQGDGKTENESTGVRRNTPKINLENDFVFSNIQCADLRADGLDLTNHDLDMSYSMFIFGGYEAEGHSLDVRPISIWKLQICPHTGSVTC